MCKLFISMQIIMPTVVSHLESLYPNKFDNLNYTLHMLPNVNNVGLNVSSNAFPSTLFWIDDTYNVKPSISSKAMEENKEEIEKIRKLIIALLKNI